MTNKLSFVIPGTIRIKKNSRRIYGFGKFKKVLPSKAYMEWESQARARFVMEHYPSGKSSHEYSFDGDFPLITTSCHVQAMFYYRGPEFDLHGAMESIADAMQGLAWEDDKLIVSWDGSRKAHDKNNARTEVTVEW
jgi:hypothetical protein